MVFYTSKGKPYIQTNIKVDDSGKEIYTITNLITTKFRRLIMKAELNVSKGTGFYTLRSNAEYLIMPSKTYLMTIEA